MRRLVTIYRSTRTDEMYLYVDHRQDLKSVPPALLERFGRPEKVVTLALDAARPLARASTADVLAQIDQAGFYLQLPPPPIPRTDTGMRREGNAAEGWAEHERG